MTGQNLNLLHFNFGILGITNIVVFGGIIVIFQVEFSLRICKLLPVENPEKRVSETRQQFLSLREYKNVVRCTGELRLIYEKKKNIINNHLVADDCINRM